MAKQDPNGPAAGGRRRRWRVVALVLAALAAHGAGLARAQEVPAEAPTDDAPPAPLTLVCLDWAVMLDACRAGAEAWSTRTGRATQVVSAPVAGRATLDQYQSLLAVESPRVDVLQIPAAWLPSLAGDLVPFGRTDEVGSASGQGRFARMLAAIAETGDGVVALPQVADLAVLYFRTDVLSEPPETWSALREALDVRTRALGTSRDQLLGLVFGGQSDITLSNLLILFLTAYGAPPLVAPDGTVTVGSAASLAAFEALDQLLGNVIAPQSADLSVVAARDLFADGDAVALLSSSMYHDTLAANAPVAPFMGIALPPAGSVEGGRKPVLVTAMFLGVSRFSRDTAAAADLAAFLASAEFQRRAAVEFGLAPTRKALYEDAAVTAARPWLATIGSAFETASVPPVAAFAGGWLLATEVMATGARALMAGEIDAPALAAEIGPALRLLVAPVGDGR